MQTAKGLRNMLLWLLAALVLLACGLLLWWNRALMLTEYTVCSGEIPEAFDGYRIVQVSDLHNARMGRENRRLLERVREGAPDIIVITGDLVDAETTDVEAALSFAARATEIAPVYYVTGNHEARADETELLLQGLSDAGVVLLDGRLVRVEKDGESITLAGAADPGYANGEAWTAEAAMDEHLSGFMASAEGYTVLLAHRPELVKCYAAHGADLVFSGHAHGGQVRIPFVGGVIAPNQGFFPMYDAGRFTEGGTTLIVSRGIGNGVIVPRVNNRPEVVLAVLAAE